MNNDIVVLPSHWSHFTQPLDLGLNAVIQFKFRDALFYVKPVLPKKKKKKKKKKECREAIEVKEKAGRYEHLEYEELMRTRNQELLAAIQEETPESSKELARSAPYKRAVIVAAIIEAIAPLKPHSIKLCGEQLSSTFILSSVVLITPRRMKRSS